MRVDALSIARVAGATAVLAWLPGRLWVEWLAPTTRGMEREFLAVVVSVALITIALYVGNIVLGVRISGLAAVSWAALLCAVPLTVRGGHWLDARVNSRLGSAR